MSTIVPLPRLEDGAEEEEEEGLERKKRKRGANDADVSPRADVRARSRSADPVRAKESTMRPPPVHSDRSSSSNTADRTTPQRTTPHRDGAGRGSTAPEASRAQGSEERLLIVNAENRRDRERVSNLFRTFSYQGVDIPAVKNMRELVRDLYARHSVALAEVCNLCSSYGSLISTANLSSATSFNRLLCGYEKMLTDPRSLQSDLTRTKEKLALTEQSLETMRVASEKNADRLRQVEYYRRQRDEARVAAATLETKVALMLKRVEIAEEKSSRFEGELTAAENSSREMAIKYEALLRLRDRDLRVSSHEVRKDVKNIGTSVVTQVRDHLLLLTKRYLMEREVAEIKANQDFLAGIQRGDYPDPEAEAASMAGDLLEVEGKLAAMPPPSLDLDELARRFDDSPPPCDDADSESTLAPLEAIPLSSAPFDQFGSMTSSLTVEDALSLRASGLPEESGSLVAEPAEGSQEAALVEEETTQSGTGLSEGVEAEEKT
ncbi:unnamed protein product [Cochlearia groenlandica]